MSKSTSFLIFLFLLFSRFAIADSSEELNSMENFIPGEEESLATVNNCVNVVTGSFFQVDHDLIVDGAEPLWSPVVMIAVIYSTVSTDLALARNIL